jgi:hypothetical protein
VKTLGITIVLGVALTVGVVGAWLAMNYYAPTRVGTPAHAGAVSNGQPQECTNINLNVRAKSEARHEVLLPKSVRVRGTFEADGGFGRVDVFLRVVSPQGLDILSSPKTDQYDFTFPSREDGVYTFVFDNRFSIFTSKSVGLYYCIETGGYAPQEPFFSPLQ